ncbi:MAG TPA: sigma-70 family RNA polymerase sigma factor [Candidatus Saccharimonadales bacterium]
MSFHEHDVYFPDESFDRDPEEQNDLLTDFPRVTKADSRFTSQLYEASREITGDTWLDKEQEAELADTIQNGAEARLLAEAMGDAYDGRYDVLIENGQEAKRQLVTANLPFAVYFANESMGQGRIPSSVDVPSVPRRNNPYMGKLKKSGTYAPVANLANQGADIEDRVQVAIEAMWGAADTFDSSKRARFITYAAWPIHRALSRHTPHEYSGWHVADHIYQNYVSSLEQQAVHGALPEIWHVTESGGRHKGLHPDQVIEGRRSVPYELTVTDGDESDQFEEPIELHLAERVEDRTESVEGRVEAGMAAVALETVLETLSEREHGVIAMRYGLDDGTPKTLDEIGKVYGLTRERIRQIESKTMAKLRNPSRSRVLKEFTDGEAKNTNRAQLLPLAEGTSHIKTIRYVARKSETPAHDDIRADDSPAQKTAEHESWQIDEMDDWDKDVRSVRTER